MLEMKNNQSFGLVLSVLMGLLCVWPMEVVAQGAWTVDRVPRTHLEDARVYVIDPDNLLDDVSQAQMDGLLQQNEAETTSEVFVVALSSVGERDVKRFATELFNHWKIGQAQKDNGLLLLMVDDQGKVSIETGYGLEGVLPDAICMRIIQQNIIPHMREGNYGAGILSGVQRITEILSDPVVADEIRMDMEKARLAEAKAQKDTIRNVVFLYLALSLLVFLFAFYRFVRKKADGLGDYARYQKLSTTVPVYGVLAVLMPLTMLPFWLMYRYRMRRLRVRNKTCSVCGSPMKRLSEQEEDAYLTSGQQSEERLGAIDYDAWLCTSCSNRTVLAYNKSFTKYKKCPNCGYRTYAQTQDRVRVMPTPFSAGTGERVYQCGHCRVEHIKKYVIPMIIIPPKGGGGGRGGFGGGGFGGGSFGGGMSGGGGATGGWR